MLKLWNKFSIKYISYVNIYFNRSNPAHEAKLLLLKLIHLFAREVLLVKKLEIEAGIQLLKLI